MNTSFGNDNIGSVRPDLFEPGRTLAQAAAEMDLDQAGFGNWIEKVPAGIQEAIRATIYSALTRSPRSAITFMWVPGNDYALSIWDVGAGPESPGGISILLKSNHLR
jgi:hypothetical protein